MIGAHPKFLTIHPTPGPAPQGAERKDFPMEPAGWDRVDPRLSWQCYGLCLRAKPRMLKKKLESVSWKPVTISVTPGITIRMAIDGSRDPKDLDFQ